MAGSDKTVFDPGATVAESDKTVLESDATVLDAGTTLLEAALSDATGQEDADARENITIQKGETILDTYRVESDAIEGGMGSVWRVHHTGWNVDLAMKRPQPKCFSTEKSKADFIHECEAWINLGLHPNIVSCYYVREISGTPSIFSEWMDGGSLESAITKGTLYAGTAAEQQERILDIAIQFARGLHYAHEAGLIHQDVKPDNVLLTKEGEAKVADFGLAHARAVLTALEGNVTVRDAADGGKTMLSPSGGYTPAYCSMEQMDGKALTRRTDIYSWAVSVMELYLGARPWANGVVAGLSCPGYFEQARVSMPEALKTLLAQCLESEPENRPHDFAEIEGKLHEIYQAETENAYPRSAPKAAADTADSLNNRALSFLDLGKTGEAENCWKVAAAIAPDHTATTWNHLLYRWQNGYMTDLETEAALVAWDDNKSDWVSAFCLCRFHVLRCDCRNARRWLDIARRRAGEERPQFAAAEKEISTLPDLSEPIVCRTDIGYARAPDAFQDGESVVFSDHSLWRLWSAYDGSFQDLVSGEDGNSNESCVAPDQKSLVATLGRNYTADRIIQYRIEDGRVLNEICLPQHSEVEDDCPIAMDERHVYYIRVSGDSRRLIKWDLHSNKKVYTIGLGSDHVYGLQLSTDGTRAAIRQSGGKLLLFDALSGEKLLRFSPNAVCARFSVDGRRIFGCDETNLYQWDSNSGELLMKKSVGLRLRQIALSGCRNILVGFSNTTQIPGLADQAHLCFINVKTGSCISMPVGKGKLDGRLCVTKNHAVLLTRPITSDVEEWRTTFTSSPFPDMTRNPQWELCRIENTQNMLSAQKVIQERVTQAKRFLAEKDDERALKALYDCRRLPGFTVSEEFMAVNNAAGLQRKKACLRGVIAGGKLSLPGKRGLNIYSLSMSPDEKNLLVGCCVEKADCDYRYAAVQKVFQLRCDGSAKPKTIYSEEWVFRSDYRPERITACYSFKGKCVICSPRAQPWQVRANGFFHNGVYCYRINAGASFYSGAQAIPSGHSDEVLYIHKNCIYALAANESASSSLFEIAESVERIHAVSKDGHYALCEGGFVDFCMLDIRQQKMIYQLTGIRESSGGIMGSFLGDGDRFVLAFGRGKIALMNTADGNVVRTQDTKMEIAGMCLVDDNGDYVLTIGRKTLRLWDMQKGAFVFAFPVHHTDIVSLCVNSTGTEVFAIDDGGVICHWILDWEYE